VRAAGRAVAAIDLFDIGAERAPERACFVFGDLRITYAEARRATLAVARGAQDLGLRPGTKAAVLSNNHPLGFLTALGLLRAGAVWLPINPRNAIAENAELLADFDCEALFYHSDFERELDVVRRFAPGIRHLICLDKEDAAAPSVAAWLQGKTAPPDPVAADPAALAAIIGTGGTTGKPKGVMLSNRNFVAFAAGHATVLDYGANEVPINLAAAPMTHVAGRLCFPILMLGGTTVILPDADPEAILAAIPAHRVTQLFLPPTAIYTLLEQPNLRPVDFSSLRYFMYGAAPMQVDKLRQAIMAFGPVMTQGYGQTEAPMLMAMMRPADHFRNGTIAEDERLGACGRPTEFVELAIMADDGRLLPPGDAGEVVVRGDIVMVGYYKSPEATAEASRFGWHHTGDIGLIDEEGFLHIVDRKKDMIISGGFNVYSAEVERVVAQFPGVRDCAVIGVPDDKWGEAVKAIVEPLPGATLDPSALSTFCRERLGGVKAPKSIEIWPSLTRNSNGKVLKKAMRDRYWADAGRRI
jgi:acyl-CoA synthetase (AMP-forming)/AMP-acid ligase II